MDKYCLQTRNPIIPNGENDGHVSCWKWFLPYIQENFTPWDYNSVQLIYLGITFDKDNRPRNDYCAESFSTIDEAYSLINVGVADWNECLFVKIDEKGVCEPLPDITLKAGPINAQRRIDAWKLKNKPHKPLHLTGLGLKELPALPENVRILYCNSNKLEYLPVLPASLYSLHCDHNNLKELPNLPEGLQELTCISNQLTVLPALPKSLNLLYCSNNKLKTIPDYEGDYIICSNNPDLPVFCEWNVRLNGPSFIADLRKAEAEVERTRIVSRCGIIKEELMADRCAPQRVERLLAQGLGLEEALEMLGMGAG
jgi:hypothetical protein